MTIPSSPEKLSVFTLMMINVAAILSLRALPGLADYGYALVFYLSMASLLFFIPSALVAAELASGWKEEGGVYLWVKEAFGPRWGFVAIFMQWVENLPWFPAVLAFAASDIAYIFNPALAENKIFVVAVIWAALWAGTLLNFRDMKLSAALSTSGAMAGSIIPVGMIIILGIMYLASGQTAAITFSPGAMVPDMNNLTQLMLLVSMLVSLQGMEMSAVHVNNVKNPGRDFPRAIFSASVLIIILCVLGALAIALVIPEDDISLSAGVCQAFEKLFALHDMPFMTPVVCLLMAYGALTMVITWMVGPSKGILAVAKDGFLPRSWQKTNKYGMPTNILLIQTSMSTLLSCAILFMPTVSSAFMLMSALAAQLYMVMYLLMFGAAIRLRYTRPDMKRGYSIPGGKAGIWIVCGLASAACVFVFIFGFIPPPLVRDKGMVSIATYIAFLVSGIVVLASAPMYLYNQAVKGNNTPVPETTTP